MTHWYKSIKPLPRKVTKTSGHGQFLICLLCCSWLTGIAQASTVHPQLVEAHVTNLDLVFEISKHRSGAGHDFSYFREELSAEAMALIHEIDNFFATDQSEPESSMKHYYSPYAQYKEENGDNSTIPVYAPFAGTITRVIEEVREADPSIVNKRVEITSSENTDYMVVLFHLNLDDAYPQILNDYPTISEIWNHSEDDPAYSTSVVAAGDLLGYADMRMSNDFDVAMLFNDSTNDKWISLFELMPDSLFAAYEARGIDRVDTIISKEYRLANPVTWGLRNDDDWMGLTPVPEPGTLSLLLVIFMWLRPRRWLS